MHVAGPGVKDGKGSVSSGLSPLQENIEGLLKVCTNNKGGTGVVLVFIPTFFATLAQYPKFFSPFARYIVEMVTSLDKDISLPPVLLRQLQERFAAHIMHMAPTELLSFAFKVPSNPDPEAGIAANAVCRACALICLDAFARGPPHVPGGLELLNNFLRRLIDLNSDDEFIVDKGKMSFESSPMSLKVSYLWVAICSLSEHIARIDAHMGQKEAKARVNVAPGGKTSVNSMDVDTKTSDENENASPGELRLDRYMLTAAFAALDTQQTPVLRHFVEVLIVQILVQSPKLIPTLTGRLQDFKHRATVSSSHIVIAGFVIRALVEPQVAKEHPQISQTLRSNPDLKPILLDLWAAALPMATSNFGHLRSATQYMIHRLTKSFQGMLLPEEEKRGKVNWAIKAYMNTFMVLEGNPDYRALYNKIDNYFNTFDPLKEASLSGMLLRATSSPILHERLSGGFLDRMKPLIQEMLSHIRRNTDHKDPDEWVLWQQHLQATEGVVSLPRSVDAAKAKFAEVAQSMLGALSETSKGTLGGNFQQKIQPLNQLYEELGMQTGNAVGDTRKAIEMAMSSKKRQNLIMIASLINKAPNLGGLTRTCEIFNVESLAVPDIRVKTNAVYKNLCVTADKWQPLVEVPPINLPEYIQKLKLKGYRILALEQAARSHKLQEYIFPEKVAVLLGREKEGVPTELLNLVDDCIEIPQMGIIRSLNVHVSGSILIWEYTKQQLQKL